MAATVMLYLIYNIVIFVSKAETLGPTISNGIFKFNFLAVVVSQISGGPKFTLGNPIPLDGN